jgi:nickel transport protein
MNTKQDFRFVVYFIIALMGLGFLVEPAIAHNVTIFAWVEGDTVFTQSKFGGGRRAQDSSVVVYDTEGNLLLEGKTDAKGEFAFKVPKKTGLKVVLKASMGHLAEWVIPAEEIIAAAKDRISRPQEISTQSAAKEAPLPSSAMKPGGIEPVPAPVDLQRQELQKMIDESLDRKITPIANMLASLTNRGPGLTEIMGGIGYIFGLMGVALYITSRKRNN